MTPSGSPAEIEALVRLLGDPDENVARTIRRHFFELGPAALPFLQRAGEDPDPLIRERAKGLVQEVRHREVDTAFQAFAARPDGALDLEEGTFLLARSEYPELNVHAYRGRLDEMAAEIGQRLKHARRPETVIQTFNDYLFVDQGFSGDTSQYYDPDNSYINRVLDRKMGIPISLSLLYIFLGTRLGQPFYGVGMPSHFIVKYETQPERIFLDPFSGGHLLTIEECNRFLVNAGYGLKEEHLTAATAREILSRMMRNLVFIYTRLDDQPRLTRLTRLLDLMHQPHGA